MKLITVVPLLCFFISSCSSKTQSTLIISPPVSTDTPKSLVTHLPNQTDTPKVLLSPTPTNTPISIEPQRSITVSIKELVLDGEDLKSSILDEVGGDGLDLTPDDGCNGRECVIRLWAIVQPKGEVQTLIITLADHESIDTAVSEFDNSKTRLENNGYIEIQLPQQPSLPEFSWAGTQDGSTILLLTNYQQYEILIALQANNYVLDNQVSVELLAKVAQVQIEKLISYEIED